MPKEILNSNFYQNLVARQNLDWLSIASQWSSLRSYFQGVSNSGILAVRQYEKGGNNALESNYTATYRPLNIHNHSNYRHLPGIAERRGMANGFIYGSRHTDYNMNEPINTGYLDTQRITYPGVPPDVVGTVAEQITIMQGYFQAMVDKNFATYDYRPYFQLALSVEEVWPELFTETLTDTFDSDRHTVDASSVQEQIWKHWRDELGGIMERGENINVWPIIPFITSTDGAPELATIKNRVTCQVVGDFGEFHPADTFSIREDVYSEEITGFTPSNPISNFTRYRVNHVIAAPYLARRYSPGLLDTLMSRCYGMEGVGTNLEEQYTDQYASTDFIVTNFDDTNPLNAAQFNRFFGTDRVNASGRTKRRRSFRDANLFCALTTYPNVLGVTDGANMHRYTWGIPLEVIVLNPLMDWNPYNIQAVADPTNGGTLDGASSATAFSGYNESQYHYLTPDAFYNGDEPIDPADTSTAKWMLDGNGTPQLCRSSGAWVMFPPIANVTERVRGRYPIYEDAVQSPEMAQALQNRNRLDALP